MTSGLRIVKEIASFFRGGGVAVRADGKIPVTVIMGNEFHRQLRGRASAAAHAVGIERTNTAWGDFVADHVSVSLEEAYESQKISDPLSPAGGDETFVTLALSGGVAKRLRRGASDDARRDGGIATRSAREDHVLRHMGRCLEASYEAEQ
jgi:hypothetical protein